MKLVQSMGIFILLTMFLVFTGCNIDEVTLESLTVTNADTDDSIGVGDTEQFTATGNYSDGSTKDLTSSVTWTSTGTDSGNNPIASITNPGGLATALTAGTATITATYTIDSVTHSDSETLTVGGANVAVSITGPATACTAAYSPDTITISVGDTVTWTNNATTDVHTITSSASSGPGCTSGGDPATTRELDSGNINPTLTYSHTFDTSGTYNYVCITSLHQMRGTVTVQ